MIGYQRIHCDMISCQRTQFDMIGCWRMHFDVTYHTYLHALLENLPTKVFKVTSQNFSGIHESWKYQSMDKRWSSKRELGSELGDNFTSGNLTTHSWVSKLSDSNTQNCAFQNCVIRKAVSCEAELGDHLQESNNPFVSFKFVSFEAVKFKSVSSESVSIEEGTRIWTRRSLHLKLPTTYLWVSKLNLTTQLWMSNSQYGRWALKRIFWSGEVLQIAMTDRSEESTEDSFLHQVSFEISKLWGSEFRSWQVNGTWGFWSRDGPSELEKCSWS